MSRRLLELRTATGQHVRLYADAGPSLYLGLSAAPAHIVVSLTPRQVEHLIGTLTGWCEEQAQRSTVQR